VITGRQKLGLLFLEGTIFTLVHLSPTQTRLSSVGVLLQFSLLLLSSHWSLTSIGIYK
jgi:hypothetical protein